MRLAAFILILFSTSAFAQPKPLFKIISCSEGVTVDGVEVKPGMNVFSDSRKLEIPKGGYAGVITIDGYAYQFSRGISVKRVPGSVKYNVEPGFKATGAVTRSIPYFEIAGYAGHHNSRVYGDSVLIAFKCYKEKPPFRMVFTNMFEVPTAEYQLNQTWKTFLWDSLLKNEDAILYQISSENIKSEEFLMMRINLSIKTRIDFDLNRLSGDPVAMLALFEINELFYDHVFQLYKIETLKGELNHLDEFLSAYLAKTRDKYHLEEYMIK